MKKRLLIFLVLIMTFFVSKGQVLDSYFIDFGPSTTLNGDITPSPDVNGNHWTNITNFTKDAPAVFLKNRAGIVSLNAKIEMPAAGLATNGKAAGGLMSPPTALAQEFRIITATQDYVYTDSKGGFKISGLDPTKKYVFKYFGSRELPSGTTAPRTTKYIATGRNIVTSELQTTGVGIGTNGYNGNNNTVAVSDVIYANSYGEIVVDLDKGTSTHAHLNCMKIEVFDQVLDVVPDNSSYLMDFGSIDGLSGYPTASPDVNGNYWTNVSNNNTTAPALYLTSTTGSLTGMNIKIGSGFSFNGTASAGGLLAPSSSLLGEFGIQNATQDYFYGTTGQLKIRGLDPAKKYVFKFFGSRENTEERISQYKLTGANISITTLKTSGAGIGANNYNGNNNNIAISDTLYVDESGEILLEVSKTAGTFFHLSAMKMEIFKATSIPKYSLNNSGFEKGDLTSWTVNGNAGSLVVNTLKNSGNYSLSLSGADNELHQEIEYLNGDNYRLSGYLYQSSSEKLNVGQAAYLRLSYYDKDNLLISSSDSESITSGKNTDEWKKYTVGTLVPPNTTFIRASLIWKGSANPGKVYFDDIKLEPYTPLDNYKIVYFGSSVPLGEGASNRAGYTKLFTDILTSRAQNGGLPWTTSNISIGGNNTVAVLDRYDRDLKPQNAKYVIFALALGNEGIHEAGQPRYDQFKANMKILIDKATDDGYTPIITNNYTRNDYNQTDYNFIKQMNLLIHSWNVPSVNLLGAIDDLAGHWVNGYWNDGLHPNDAGHAEMAYTIVPSMFDALSQNKAIPKKQNGSFITLVNSEGKSKLINFEPENIVHPFSTTLSIKTSHDGSVIQVQEADGLGKVSVTNGVLVYSSSKGGTITGETLIKDDQWHKITLTHYYAKGETMLYCDSILQGKVNEKLVLKKLHVGGQDSPQKLQLKDWLFYRSAMNSDEIKYISRDSLLKSSLELFAPLDGRAVSFTDSLLNIAQSTNAIAIVEINTLPLNFMSFSTVKSGNSVALKWATANEKDNKYFNVLHSVNNIDWEIIGIVKAGIKSENQYQYLHTKPVLGTNYYKLEQVDLDGKASYSEIKAVKINFLKQELLCFPSPVKGELNIQLEEDPKKASKYVLYNVTGVSSKEGQINSRTTIIDTNNLKSGIYFLKIEGHEVYKIIKE